VGIVQVSVELWLNEVCDIYKVKRIISTNAVELELLRTVKIHPVVNVSRIRRIKKEHREMPGRFMAKTLYG